MARYGDRYCNDGFAVMKWYQEIDGMEACSHFDICDKCIGDRGNELLTKSIRNVIPYGENEPVGEMLVGIERPPYTEMGDCGNVFPAMSEWYRCASCDVILVDEEDAIEDGFYDTWATRNDGSTYVKKVAIKLKKGGWS
tara:strand:+ start:480 stop:896 length:417 start_codon:yes stop_codon:yes gene_type:complete